MKFKQLKRSNWKDQTIKNLKYIYDDAKLTRF